MKIPYLQFNEIGLGSIARKGCNEDIMKFLELVFFVIINCPQKETFIRRIMELDERSQYFLMLFIKKTLGDGSDDVIKDTELNKKEIEILRNEKARLAQQLLEIQQECVKNRECKEKLQKENEELKLSVIDLQSELSKSPNKQNTNHTEVYHRLEKKLAEKTHLLNTSQEFIRDLQAKYDKEMAQLRDELDIAQSKIYQINQAEKSLENYKKKVEKMGAMKKRLIELKRNNENMQRLIIEHQYEIETYQQYKKSSLHYKEEYNKEKEKSDNLAVALESKEKQISKLNKIALEMSDKILYQENRIHELEVPLDSSFVSEDSFNFGKIDSDNDYKRPSRTGVVLTGSNNNQTDVLIKEINNVKNSLLKKKNELAICRETIFMQNEELLTKNGYNAMLIAQLSCRNEAMADKLFLVSENISNGDNEKENYKHALYELNNLKNYKDSLLSEIKNLYEEKDLIYKKYISGREETIVLNNKAHNKEIIIRDLQFSMKILTEKLKIYEKNDSDKKTFETEEIPSKLERLEKKLQQSEFENYELKLRIIEKDKRIDEVLKEKNDTIKNLQSEHSEELSKFKHESE